MQKERNALSFLVGYVRFAFLPPFFRLLCLPLDANYF